MIRLYRPLVEQLLAALTTLRVAIRDVMPPSRNHIPGNVAINDAYRLMTSNHWQEQIASVSDWLTIDQLITQLKLQVKQSEANIDVDLVDQVVNICKFPYIGSTLTPQVIRNLQKAILLPEELNELKETIKKKEMVCYSCAHTFLPGEMVIFDIDTVSGSVRFSCTGCQTPTRINCPCGKTRGISETLYRKIIKEMKTCTHNVASTPDAEGVGATGIPAEPAAPTPIWGGQPVTAGTNTGTTRPASWADTIIRAPQPRWTPSSRPPSTGRRPSTLSGNRTRASIRDVYQDTIQQIPFGAQVEGTIPDPDPRFNQFMNPPPPPSPPQDGGPTNESR
jgi:hypothetical protein